MKLQSLRLGSRLIRTSIFLAFIAFAIAGYLLVPPQSAATMATLNVNTTADTVDAVPGDGVCADSSGNCSIRAAVMEANALGGPDTITIPAGLYTLTRTPFDDEFNFDGANESIGDIDILNGDVTIIGAGAATTIISGGNIDRIFDINSGFTFSPGTPGNVRIEGLTLRNGNAPTDSFGFFHSGGAIQVDGLDWNSFIPANISLTLVNCAISNNKASGVGGGIASFNAASVDISGTSFSANESTNSQGGAVFFDGASDPGTRTLTIANGTFNANKASHAIFGSGGAVWAGGRANISVNNNNFTGNIAGANGGGVFSDPFLAANQVTIEKNRFTGNSSKQGGGAFVRTGTTNFNLNLVVGNTASTDATSTGVRQQGGAAGSSVSYLNNWWGCNTGPSAAPCDRINTAVLGTGPWLVLRHAATPSTVNTGASASLQADFFTPSSGSPIPPADLVALNGRAITFNNAVLGTISGADTQISAGKANATYTAGGTGGAGSADATVDSATATASITVTQPPDVTTDPVDQTVCAGGSATFTAASAGFPTPTVQWQVSTDGGATFTDISGATNTTLTFTAFPSVSGNKYRAVFTNAGGTDTTAAATLTVNTAPSVETNPISVEVCDGGTASFTAAAVGSPAPTVQWQVNTGSGFTDIPGATSTTLSFTATTSQNGNTYRAVFSNECGNTPTNAATLTVNAGTSATTPADQTVCQGGNASFSTTASGTGPFTYQWKLDGADIGGATNSSVSIATGSLSGGNHSVEVVVSGTCGTATKSATLTVNTAPTITLNPVSQQVTPPNSVTFTAAANGTPAPTVQWQVSTNGGASFADIPGATSTSLTFATNASQNGNQYRAVFTNECGSATTTAATLTTCEPAEVTGSPVSVADACVGTVVNFSASATGNPTPTVQWQVSTDGGATWNNIPGATSTTLSVTASVAVRNNQYRAVFTNDCGTDTTAAATLGVDTIAPVITLNSNISLWPPNHEYSTISITDIVASVTDNCSSNLLSSVVITSVSSDEPENGDGDGDTFNDIVIAADCKTVQVRAERQNSGNGRVYRINVKVVDSGGNVTTATATVSVPKTQGGDPAVDDGPANGYTATSNCP